MVDYDKLQILLDQIEHNIDEATQLLAMSRAFDSQVPCLGACNSGRTKGKPCADDTCVCWVPAWRPISEAKIGERFLFWDSQSGIEVIGQRAHLKTLHDTDADVIISDEGVRILGTTEVFTHFCALPDPPYTEEDE